MGRRTWLKFDDFTSDPFEVSNGTTQGCPLAMLFYAFYNALLIQVATDGSKSKLTSGFVDDTMFLATAKSLTACHDILGDMMHCHQGGLDWSDTHNSPFELSKLALMNFPQLTADIAPDDLTIM